MSKGFWDTLPRPVLALAPMVGVTDAAFRRIVAKYGKPDVLWTEFVSAEGLCSRGRDRLKSDLLRTDSERPIVAQIYGCRAEAFTEAARLIVDLGFDGIDINMGCPAREVERRRAGAALIKNPEQAQALIEATKAGAAGLPVSVKTRIGYRVSEIETWLPRLIRAEPAAIVIHARTRNEMSKVPARWDVVQQAVQLASALRPDESTRPLIIGNGDVKDPAEARLRALESGCDGVMIGRGIFGNPWLFNPTLSRSQLSPAEIIAVMLEHTELYMSLLARVKPIEQMKKHYKAYVNNFHGATELRVALMEARDYDEVLRITRDYLAEHGEMALRGVCGPESWAQPQAAGGLSIGKKH